ncbi:hypothetical protein BGZ79_001146, partial [Entomortierella chlamydospora]
MEHFLSRGLAQNVCTNVGRSNYSVKGAAETFRRVIGVAVVHGGVDAAMKVTGALGAELDPAVTSISSIRVIGQLNRVVDLKTPITVYNVQALRIVDIEMRGMIQQVQEVLGYDAQLLLETMTHKSATMKPSSYERIELLGDVVLGFSEA